MLKRERVRRPDKKIIAYFFESNDFQIPTFFGHQRHWHWTILPKQQASSLKLQNSLSSFGTES